MEDMSTGNDPRSSPARRGRPPRQGDRSDNLTKAELSRMADIAKEKGVQIEAEVGGRIIRVTPHQDAAMTRGGIVIPPGGVRL